ncbi:MAG TPA: MobA/MobL family protein [Steroidobacteraceae bacterium]
MAIDHYSHKPVSRSRGQSAVAGAAYRAGEKLYDRRLDQVFDYSRRSGIAHAEIVLSTQAAQRDINWARRPSGAVIRGSHANMR